MSVNITSAQNPRIKAINKLKTKKIRNETGLGVIEGERIIFDAIKQNIRFETIVVVEEFENKFKDLIKTSACNNVLVLPKSLFNTISSTENSQGILAVVEIKDRVFELPKNNFLVLDGIQDPGNLGTIIRTAVALNFKDIYLFNCVDFRNDKVLRATMGTIFKANLFILNEDKLRILSEKSILLLADVSGEPLKKFKPNTSNFGIILCNEGNGPSKQVLSIKSKKIAIEMTNDVESLNVSSAGAILMYELSWEKTLDEITFFW